VTHGISYLPHVDQIVVLKEGVISEYGTYDELMRNNGAFAEFLKDQLQERDSDSSGSESGNEGCKISESLDVIEEMGQSAKQFRK